MLQQQPKKNIKYFLRLNVIEKTIENKVEELVSLQSCVIKKIDDVLNKINIGKLSI